MTRTKIANVLSSFSIVRAVDIVLFTCQKVRAVQVVRTEDFLTCQKVRDVQVVRTYDFGINLYICYFTVL